ncbi:hypothetical protein BCR33DRAFT_170711 [Rhizoclosmatium globosum]|uniref:Uncharacterized protein n=1 Tax=Rhizoclosmatium globosum TaxID=329046 RepID=A0A1Y2CF86_9FUNG|nr:hypothetical protein BCR33DRAFT_170711 [Rhizoclosmatium globosum]|eukprot:ORY45586.1 hypothetical protein BCR33DRAFT_170711 [Rhizoclosmatium globosum]
MKKEREDMEKQRRRAEEIKKEREMEQFNPWGKAGAGAPLRNSDGTVSTNLRNTRSDPNNPQQSHNMSNQYGGGGVGGGGGMQHPPDQSQIAQQLGMNFLSQLASGFAQPYGAPAMGIASQQPQSYATTGFGGFANGGQQQQQQQQLPKHDAPKTFLRGQVNVDQMPDWQRAEIEQKHKAQLEIQEALKKQVQEREAVKAKLLAEKQAEEAKEQERIVKEQEFLRLRYARELEEQRRKKPKHKPKTTANSPRSKQKLAKTKQGVKRLCKKLNNGIRTVLLGTQDQKTVFHSSRK